MGNKKVLQVATLLLIVLLVGALAILTQQEEDPCANPQADITGAILADDAGDQDALANRAILMRAQCEGQSLDDLPATEAGPGQSSLTKPQTVAVNSPQEIVQYRCMVCHGCYDAPCQLKLEAHEGLVRGGSKQLVYDGARLRAANLSRLFDDAQGEQAWRDKGFYSVLDPNEPEQGVMYRMLALKQAHPLPATGAIPQGFDFSLYRDQQCPRQDEFDRFASDNPLWGMPYGLPGLNNKEHNTLANWIRSGARETLPAPLDEGKQRLFDDWEAFLNGDSLQRQLMSRYLYEHLFLASIYLRKEDAPDWFRLVRSRTPPGQAIDLIATRRPYDDPGVKRVYYRLQRMPSTVLAKTHLPYRWDQQRMDWYRKLFLEAGPAPEKLPGYAPEVASNPFRSFIDIPVDSRYRFLLAEAQFTIMNFIKGPVCRGQIALNVIQDHFWVMFANPDKVDPVNDAEFLAREMDNLVLPSPKTGTLIDILRWRKYAKAHEKYQRARSRYIRERLAKGSRLELDSIWDGNGNNNNASLTVFRHFDTASVVRGFVGETPKTAWVIDYPLLERIYYLLVAGFDVYGAAAHQLESRLYMDFLRMEGEFNFLLFMPPEQRLEIHDYWYRDARKGTRDHFLKRSAMVESTHDYQFKTDDPKKEFLDFMGSRIYGARDHRYIYRGLAPQSTAEIFEQLEASPGAHNSYLPHTSIINVVSGQRDEVYTLLRNASHSNIAQMFKEEKHRLPEEDTLTIVRGFIGAYPNYFFQLNEQELASFAQDLQALKSEGDYLRLLERYGVRRNASWFWRLSDKLHGMYRQQDSIEYGVLDYNRYLGF
jgi:Fatty acid cis/trans isomerase (CTI)